MDLLWPRFGSSRRRLLFCFISYTSIIQQPDRTIKIEILYSFLSKSIFFSVFRNSVKEIIFKTWRFCRFTDTNNLHEITKNIAIDN